MLRSLSRVDLLLLDDWGPEPLNAEQRRDLLEIVEDRYDARSIMITSQVPVDRWYEIIGDPTLADAILDRIVHNAYRIELSGETLRKPPPADECFSERARRNFPSGANGQAHWRPEPTAMRYVTEIEDHAERSETTRPAGA